MASLPPQRPASQRRQSPSTADSASSSQHAQSGRTNSVSNQSVDSQTLLLNSSPSQSAKPTELGQKTASTTIEVQQPDSEPRKCWICFSDETEDDPTTSVWRSPCPCVLVAHERCLLDWVADLEAPTTRGRAGGQNGKIQCPQCKSEIKLKRPQSKVVNAVRRLERVSGMMMLPGFLFLATTGMVATLTLAGQTAVVQIFGLDDASVILQSQMPAMPDGTPVNQLLLEYLRLNWRLNLGVPLIPTVLLASRTTWADSILPFLPLVFFVKSGQSKDDLLQFSWPPSAAFTIAALPYVRGIYNAYYERVWEAREQQWLKEIQPRADTDAEIRIEDEHMHDILLEDEDADNEGDIEDLDVEVDFDIFANWNNGGAADNNNANENPPVPIAPGPGHPLNGPPIEGDDNNEEPLPLIDIDNQPHQHHRAPAPNVPQQPAQPRRQRVRRERGIAFSTTSISDTILGALIFPSIAAVAGEVLKSVLPKAWVTLPAGRSSKPTGFLQTKWGRSILGGCLVVGVKDAVMLYVRWKMAQNHRMRTVLDYAGKRKRGNNV
ncbi:hypothetical protein K505DRAFT_326818 [Melanomma pulvis-pyrius CBS 109.77]|uniref:RING-CH-type domain-containing protein n=1 Tax=Melanomma pulvis-pyrius CBS 109.77 TaxID=1314802 RepID=A0A6A6X5J3_9PLEO|nr:hypothetical protein K505DRAFT_326818 [Melanomma pulvis-pyrius CBS 109.77]